MTKNTDTLIYVVVVAVTFFLLGQHVQKSNTENISDQRYKNTSLQYMEDIRNALDYIADNQ